MPRLQDHTVETADNSFQAFDLCVSYRAMAESVRQAADFNQRNALKMVPFNASLQQHYAKRALMLLEHSVELDRRAGEWSAAAVALMLLGSKTPDDLESPYV